MAEDNAPRLAVDLIKSLDATVKKVTPDTVFENLATEEDRINLAGLVAARGLVDMLKVRYGLTKLED